MQSQIQLVSNKIGGLGLGTPLLLVAMISMMILPLPPFILDVLFTFNIAVAMIVILAGVYCQRPLDFAVFPTVLLVSTLLRLALNVASTRVVLLNGHMGTDAAGQVVESFGEVVVGGNYVVGMVVFAILMVINFVVVTKGAGRISEVSARFTLDALPGKQMAIDADLNAGIINQEEAKNRRVEVSQEADFYGAMDGASKFVRGDAIAGIVILLINFIGGLFIGLIQHDLSFADAMHNYALLTIGDGLVAQVPSILLSTAAAIVVTRVSKAQDMGGEMMSQLLGNSKILYITAGIIFLLGIIPGMPHFAFLSLASIVAGIGYYQQVKPKEETPEISEEHQTVAEEAQTDRDISWDDVNRLDIIGLEVGYRLISMVDKSQGGQLLARIKGLRKKLSQDLGFLIPTVHIKDNLDLQPNDYRVLLNGVSLGTGIIHPGKLMAINSGEVFGEITGIAGKDPAFGLDAIWIDTEQKEQAQSLGYTVVDADTVIATHVSQLIEQNASVLFGHEEAQKLFDQLAETAPKLVEALIPDGLPLSVVVKVLQQLLEEQVSIRDIRSIAQTLAEHCVTTKDPQALTEAVRMGLSRHITQQIYGVEQNLPIMTLEPELEQILQKMNQGTENHLSLEPTMAENMQLSLKACAEKNDVAGRPNVLVVQPAYRKLLSQLLRPVIKGLHVLSFVELPSDKEVTIVGSIG